MRGTLTLLLVLTGVLALGTLPGGAAAGHDPTGPDGHPLNFTWTPYDLAGGPSNNHLPGLSDASHASLSTSQNPGGFKRLQFVVVRSDDVDFSGCSAQQARAFGIDRGDDDPGTTVNEDLLDNYEQSSFEEDRIVIDFYEDSDFGGNAPYINSSDQLVSAVANCFGNPDEPGWYRVKGKLNGTTWEEEEQALAPYSHYFYICECENEAEARDTLGPPPSERDGDGPTPTPTPTPAGTATPTPTPTATPGQGTGGTTPTATGAGSGPGAGPTATDDGPDRTGTASGGTATRPASGDDRGVPTTPTFAQGPGFGVAAALGALLAAAALALRD